MTSWLSKLLIVALLLMTATTQASAENTLALYGDTGNGLSRFIFTDDQPFDIVALATVDVPHNVWAFVMTELTQVYPAGVFKTNTVRVNDTPLDLGDNSLGEYLPTGACVDWSPVEVVRITYWDMTGTTIGDDVVLGVRGFLPGDTTTDGYLDGQMRYVTCNQMIDILEPEVWSEYGMPDDPALAGAALLNPGYMPVDAEITSMGVVKSRY